MALAMDRKESHRSRVAAYLRLRLECHHFFSTKSVNRRSRKITQTYRIEMVVAMKIEAPSAAASDLEAFAPAASSVEAVVVRVAHVTAALDALLATFSYRHSMFHYWWTLLYLDCFHPTRLHHSTRHCWFPCPPQQRPRPWHDRTSYLLLRRLSDVVIDRLVVDETFAVVLVVVGSLLRSSPPLRPVSLCECAVPPVVSRWFHVSLRDSNTTCRHRFSFQPTALGRHSPAVDHTLAAVPSWDHNSDY